MPNEPARGLSGYDAELRRHNEVLRRACGVRLHDHVLDIGCGTGRTTRQAARTAQAGSALGVDVSASAIERARELARAVRAACRVVCPLPHPMSSTWSSLRTPQARRRTWSCRRSSAS